MPDRPARILVVEDEGLVAMALEEILLAAGYDVAGPVDTTAKALDLLSGDRVDGAVLDVNLGGERVDLVAHALAAKDIPFIFATGYAATAALPEGFRDRITLLKPYTADQLEDALGRSLGD
jgi:two-component SAPR family response regulator